MSHPFRVERLSRLGGGLSSRPARASQHDKGPNGGWGLGSFFNVKPRSGRGADVACPPWACTLGQLVAERQLAQPLARGGKDGVKQGRREGGNPWLADPARRHVDWVIDDVHA